MVLYYILHRILVDTMGRNYTQLSYKVIETQKGSIAVDMRCNSLVFAVGHKLLDNKRCCSTQDTFDDNIFLLAAK